MKRSRESDDSSLHSDDMEDDFSESDDSGEERSEANHSLMADIRFRLNEPLSQLTTAMAFASSGSCPTMENPGIVVSGVGAIGLPLSTRDAELISNFSHPAPYGRGSDTIVDLTVRKTQELNADQFKLENPKWENALAAIVHSVATDLYIPGKTAGIKAVPYKMLLYGKGAMFKEHRDSEKEPHMFATLVICLPSRHEGGEVHVTHGGQKKILRTAESSAFGLTYLCWYADVRHEITEVTSGYRFVITYNLVNVNSHDSVKVPAEFISKEKELEDTLTFWMENYKGKTSGCPTVLAYVLEHLYTAKNLSYSGLKGGDFLRGQCIAKLCAKLGFVFFLAELQRGVDGICGYEDNDEDAWQDLFWRAHHNEEPEIHEITEVSEEWVVLPRIVDLDGTELLDKVPFSKKQIVQEEPFAGDPTREEFSGPTGNQGVSATHFYHRTVAILLPMEHEIEFFYRSYDASGKDMRGWIDELIEECDLDNREHYTTRDLRKACQLVTHGTTQWRAKNYYIPSKRHGSDCLMGKVMRAGVLLSDQNLCIDALSAVMEKMPQPETVEMIKRFGFLSLKSHLASSIQRFNAIHYGLQTLMGIYDEYRTLAGSESKTLADILTWMKDQIERLFGRIYMKCDLDGTITAQVGIRCGRNYLIEKLIPAINFQVQNARTVFRKHLYRAVLEFLAFIAASQRSEVLADNTIPDVFHAVLGVFIPNITLVDCDNTERIRISSYYIPSTCLDWEKIIQLLRQCISLDLKLETHQLLDRLKGLALDEEQHPAITFNYFFLPLAKKLCEMTADQSLSPLAQEVQKMAPQYLETILDIYVTRCVGRKPTPPMDWRRGGSSLVNPAQEEARISGGIVDRAGEEPESQSTWLSAVKCWEEDRDAAQKQCKQIFGDEETQKSLEKRLARLSKNLRVDVVV